MVLNKDAEKIPLILHKMIFLTVKLRIVSIQIKAHHTRLFRFGSFVSIFPSSSTDVLPKLLYDKLYDTYCIHACIKIIKVRKYRSLRRKIKGKHIDDLSRDH